MEFEECCWTDTLNHRYRLVPDDDLPYKGVDLPQALSTATHWTDGDLVSAIGRFPLRDLFIGVEDINRVQ